MQSKSKRLNLRIKSTKLGLAIDMMEANIEDPISVPQIAINLGLSQRQLQRIFKQHIGRTPRDVYAELRLNHGRLLLLQTAMPIMEISLASGFSSQSNFSKCYHRHFGYSPYLERQHAI